LGTIVVRVLLDLRRLVVNLAFQAICLSICGCADRGDARWTEEVRSYDGSVFLLEGHASKGKMRIPGSRRTTIEYVEYYHRPSEAYWKQGTEYRPAVFDVVSGRPVVLVAAYSDSHCYRHGFPEQGFLAFEWTDRGWQETAMSNLPVDRMTFSVLRAIFHREDPKQDANGLITLAWKEAREPTIQLAKRISEWGKRCADVRKDYEKGRVSEIGPAPLLTGFHGQPIFAKK